MDAGCGFVHVPRVILMVLQQTLGNVGAMSNELHLDPRVAGYIRARYSPNFARPMSFSAAAGSAASADTLPSLLMTSMADRRKCTMSFGLLLGSYGFSLPRPVDSGACSARSHRHLVPSNHLNGNCASDSVNSSVIDNGPLPLRSKRSFCA